MRIAIILNGISRNKGKFYRRIYPSLAQEFNTTIFETRYAGHAEKLASQAVADRYEVVIAAGGDGTLHQVTNGLLKHDGSTRPALGIIPLGTGNDFARCCHLRPDASQISSLLRTFRPKPTDVGQITCVDKDGKNIIRYFINVCSLGMGPEVVRRLVKSNRAWGPTLTYYASILSTFFAHRPVEVLYKTRDSEWKGKARVIAIANGQSFGNAMYVAPGASIDDGKFSSFIAGEIHLIRFLIYLQMVKGRRKIVAPGIMYHTLEKVELSSSESCLLEGDGEIEGLLPATITVVPGKIAILR